MVLVLNKEYKQNEINAFLKQLEKKQKKNAFDPRKFLGKVKSFKNIDPVKAQKQMRNEW